jgi:hypothetical protein
MIGDVEFRDAVLRKWEEEQKRKEIEEMEKEMG